MLPLPKARSHLQLLLGVIKEKLKSFCVPHPVLCCQTAAKVYGATPGVTSLLHRMYSHYPPLLLAVQNPILMKPVGNAAFLSWQLPVRAG